MNKFSKGSILTLIVSFVLGLTGPVATFAATATVVDLGSILTNNFVILSETGITNVPTSNITGNIGTSLNEANTNTAFAGLTCGEVTGLIYSFNSVGPLSCVNVDATLIGNAVGDMGTAYTYASNEAPGTGAFLNAGSPAGTLNGQTLAPGVYTWDNPVDVTITGDITLSGGANDVWVFQIPGTLSIATNKKIILSGGAQAKNIFWRVADVVSLLDGSHFEGNILAKTNIAMGTDASLNGRALAQTAVTLISNTVAISAPAPVVAPTVNRRRASPTPIVPIVGILKVPTPLALPNGPGSVTYNYAVWNVAKLQDLVDVTVIDDKCSPVVLVSGDSNKDGILGLDEKWNYSCTATLANTTTNTAIATAHSSDGHYNTAIATAIATVVVGIPVQPPLIHIVKIPSQLTPLAFGGGDINYTYTVTNPGVVAMKDVTVTDDKCSPVSYSSGDINGNNSLDVNETWIYSCKTNVQVSTGSVATVKGDANGFTANAYAFVNVLVSAPDLPSTGFTPEGMSWTTAILLGIIVVLAVSLIVSRKKQNLV